MMWIAEFDGNDADKINESYTTREGTDLVERYLARIESFRFLFNRAGKAMFILDSRGNIVLANTAAHVLLDASKGRLAGRNFYSLLQPGQSIGINEQVRMDGGLFVNASLRNGRDKGQDVQIGMTRFKWDEEDMMMMIVQRSARSHQVPSLYEQSVYRTVFTEASDLICLYDQNGRIMAMNPAGSTMAGIDQEDLIGRSVYDLFAEGISPSSRRHFELSLTNGAEKIRELNMRSRGGEVYNLEFSLKPIYNQEGIPIFLGIGREISENSRNRNRLVYDSSHDSLTGLYNRTYFFSEMERMENGDFDPIGMVVCELGLYNSPAMGGSPRDGEILLKNVARVLKDSFRDGDVIARLGAGEFGVLMPGANWNGVKAALRRLDRSITLNNCRSSQGAIGLSRGSAVSYARFKSLRASWKDACDRMHAGRLSDKGRCKCGSDSAPSPFRTD